MSIKELASIRHSDKILYLPYEEFKHRYPLEEKEFNKGAFGKIYLSLPKYVVKVFEPDIQLNDLCIELNAYSTNIHPCILKPLAWSVDNTQGLLAMKKGDDIMDAYQAGKITIQQIIFDTLSAITFLNSRGIAHCDIKPPNMIFHKGKCKMIDMGLSRKAELDITGLRYITDVAYTPGFIDPEYNASQYNSITAEIYSLVASYVYIMTGTIGEVYCITCTEIDWLIKEARLPLDQRTPINILLDKAQSLYGFTPYIGTILDEPPISSYCDAPLSRSMQSLINIIPNKAKVESLFLALHLMNRTYEQIKERKDLNINIFACVSMSLAMTITYDNIIRIKSWKSIIKCDDFETLYTNMLINILTLTGGIIYTVSYWDYATSKEDLIVILKDIVNCRPISPRIGGVNNKCITMGNFLTNEQRANINTKEDNIRNDIIFIDRTYPCILDTQQNIKYVIDIWDPKKICNDEYIMNILVPALLHNRDTLGELDITLAWIIFDLLVAYSSTSLIAHTLHVICKFKWMDYPRRFLKNSSIHPFILTNDDLK